MLAGVLIDEKDKFKLGDIGAKDSKLVSKRNRELISKKIMELAKNYEVIVVPPQEIDEALFSQESNLNKLEAVKSAMLINKFNPDIAILDCPSPNVDQYTEYLKTFLKNKKVKLIVEHKADYKYSVVGAASILAKVTRDESIEKLKKKYGEIGSGYLTDEITQKFIKENFELYPEIFRKSWKTFNNLKKSKEQKKIGSFSQ